MSRRNRNQPSFETMEAVRDSVDIGFNSEGDLMLKPEDQATGNVSRVNDEDSEEKSPSSLDDLNGSLPNDIATVGNVRGRALEQIITKRLLSEPGDWERDPYSGAYLSQFVGEKLNQATLSNIKNGIIKTLTYDGLIRTSNLKVEVMPITNYSIGIVILVNDVFSSKARSYSFGFDLSEQDSIITYT